MPARRHHPLRVPPVQLKSQGCSILEADPGEMQGGVVAHFSCERCGFKFARLWTPALPCTPIKVLPPNRGAGGDQGLRTMRAGVGLVPGRGSSLPIPPEEEEREAGTEAGRQTGRDRDRDKQTDRQTARQTDRQTDRERQKERKRERERGTHLRLEPSVQNSGSKKLKPSSWGYGQLRGVVGLVLLPYCHGPSGVLRSEGGRGPQQTPKRKMQRTSSWLQRCSRSLDGKRLNPSCSVVYGRAHKPGESEPQLPQWGSVESRGWALVV